MTEFKMSKKEVLEYAQETNREQAYNILLLLGYDGYDGSVEEYDELMEFLQS